MAWSKSTKQRRAARRRRLWGKPFGSARELVLVHTYALRALDARVAWPTLTFNRSEMEAMGLLPPKARA